MSIQEVEARKRARLQELYDSRKRRWAENAARRRDEDARKREQIALHEEQSAARQVQQDDDRSYAYRLGLEGQQRSDQAEQQADIAYQSAQQGQGFDRQLLEDRSFYDYQTREQVRGFDVEDDNLQMALGVANDARNKWNQMKAAGRLAPEGQMAWDKLESSMQAILRADLSPKQRIQAIGQWHKKLAAAGLDGHVLQEDTPQQWMEQNLIPHKGGEYYLVNDGKGGKKPEWFTEPTAATVTAADPAKAKKARQDLWRTSLAQAFTEHKDANSDVDGNIPVPDIDEIMKRASQIMWMSESMDEVMERYESDREAEKQAAEADGMTPEMDRARQAVDPEILTPESRIAGIMAKYGLMPGESLDELSPEDRAAVEELQARAAEQSWLEPRESSALQQAGLAGGMMPGFPPEKQPEPPPLDPISSAAAAQGDTMSIAPEAPEMAALKDQIVEFLDGRDPAELSKADKEQLKKYEIIWNALKDAPAGEPQPAPEPTPAEENQVEQQIATGPLTAGEKVEFDKLNAYRKSKGLGPVSVRDFRIAKLLAAFKAQGGEIRREVR